MASVGRERVVDTKSTKSKTENGHEESNGATLKILADTDLKSEATKASTMKYEDENYEYTSSEEEEEEYESDDSGPPPMIQIERSAELGALKEAFQTMKDKKAPVKNRVVIEERFGKENLSNITSNFEKPPQIDPKTRERITSVDKEQYSSVKNKFEHLSEEMENKEKERRALNEVDSPPALGADNVAERKTAYEKIGAQKSIDLDDKKQIEIERSEADRKRVKETFFEPSDKEEPRECAVCGKMVYSVEKLLLEKRVYHKACFKCHTCQKALSVQGYTAHEGNLYCKVHILEIYKPDNVLTHEATEESEMIEPEEDEDYVLVTKPKILDPSVVRSGFKTTDDLENVPKLQSMKARWEEPAESKQPEKRANDVEALIKQGKVKSRLSRFAEGGEEIEKTSDDEEERDPNIIRESKKKKEPVQLEIDAKSIKSKWETGEVEKAHLEHEDRNQELEELKKNVSVKERYKERTEEENVQKKSTVEEEPLDTTFTKSAKEKFQKGEVYQENAVGEKTKEEMHFAEMDKVKQRFEKGQSMDENDKYEKPIVVRSSEMSDIKASFEKGKSGDEKLAEGKRQKIEAEFKRIEREKRIMLEKDKREAEELARSQGEVPEDRKLDEIRQTADMSSIKKSFEEGKAFQRLETEKKRVEDDLEIKVAGKAREKFKKLDQEPTDKSQDFTSRQETSKWASTETRNMPEPVNRRAKQDDDEDEEEYEFKNSLNKFKNFEEQAGKQESAPKEPKPKRKITPPPDGYRAEIESDSKERDPDVITGENSGSEIVKVQAKSIKEKFEKRPEEMGVVEVPTAAEKRKQIEDEFKRIKEMKEQLSVEEPKSDETPIEPSKPDLSITAGRAQKARAKWDKIQRKEAKKAEKAARRTPAAASTAKDSN